MKEIDAQSMVVDLVRSRGGAAHKMSNRFLVGVADLLVKPRVYPAAVVEVKLSHYVKELESHTFMLDVTALQWKFLQDYRNAGMRAGVLSFIEIGGRGKLGLMGAMFSLDGRGGVMYRRGDHVRISQHVPLGDTRTRDDALSTILEELCNG